MTVDIGTTPTTITEREPAPEPKKNWTWGDLVHFLQHEASFDEEFAEAVRSVRESQGPARAAEWPD